MYLPSKQTYSDTIPLAHRLQSCFFWVQIQTWTFFWISVSSESRDKFGTPSQYGLKTLEKKYYRRPKTPRTRRRSLSVRLCRWTLRIHIRWRRETRCSRVMTVRGGRINGIRPRLRYARELCDGYSTRTGRARDKYSCPLRTVGRRRRHRLAN